MGRPCAPLLWRKYDYDFLPFVHFLSPKFFILLLFRNLVCLYSIGPENSSSKQNNYQNIQSFIQRASPFRQFSQGQKSAPTFWGNFLNFGQRNFPFNVVWKWLINSKNIVACSNMSYPKFNLLCIILYSENIYVRINVI